MNGLPVLQRDHPEDSAFHLRDLAPKTETIVLLRFHLKQGVTDSYTPFLLQVRPLSQDLFLKLVRKRILDHVTHHTLFVRTLKPFPL
jgi:hypothetical protein